MHILTLAVHLRAQRISAHCVKSPAPANVGGMHSTVYPGGSFMGFSFAALWALGAGRHEVTECDEYDFQSPGVPPSRTREQEQIAWFEETLFGYQQGAFTSLEVLGVAERVLDALSADRKNH